MWWIANVVLLFLVVASWGILRQLVEVPFCVLMNLPKLLSTPGWNPWIFATVLGALNLFAAAFAVETSIYITKQFIGVPSMWFVGGAIFIIWKIMVHQTRSTVTAPVPSPEEYSNSFEVQREEKGRYITAHKTLWTLCGLAVALWRHL